MQESTVKLWLQNVQTISTYTTELTLHRERNKFRDVSSKIMTPSDLIHQSTKRKVSQIIALLIFLAKIQIYPQHRSQSRHFFPDYSPNFRPPMIFSVTSCELPDTTEFADFSGKKWQPCTWHARHSLHGDNTTLHCDELKTKTKWFRTAYKFI